MPFAEGIPTVEVKLDKPRALGFTLGSLRRVKDRLGTLDVKVEGPEGLLALPTCVWASLDAEGRKELTVEQIEDMIYPGNMQEISTAVAQLFKQSTPDAKENPTVEGPASEPGS